MPRFRFRRSLFSFPRPSLPSLPPPRLPHTLSILVAQRPPNTDLSLHLTLTAPAPLNQQWMGEYTRPCKYSHGGEVERGGKKGEGDRKPEGPCLYSSIQFSSPFLIHRFFSPSCQPFITDIEELTGRTSDSGPISSFAAFVRLLVGALHHQSQGEGEAKRGVEGAGDDGGGRIEWPTPEELEGRLQAARRRRKDTNPLSMTTTISSSSSKRYLILTHMAGAARVSPRVRKGNVCLCRHVLAPALAVICFLLLLHWNALASFCPHLSPHTQVHYPLPLRLLQTSNDREVLFPTVAMPSPSSPRPFLLFDATAAGQVGGGEGRREGGCTYVLCVLDQRSCFRLLYFLSIFTR